MRITRWAIDLAILVRGIENKSSSNQVGLYTVPNAADEPRRIQFGLKYVF